MEVGGGGLVNYRTVGIWIAFLWTRGKSHKAKSAHAASFTLVASFHSPESAMWTPPWGQWFNLSPTNTSCVCVFSVDYVIHTKSSSFQLYELFQVVIMLVVLSGSERYAKTFLDTCINFSSPCRHPPTDTVSLSRRTWADFSPNWSLKTSKGVGGRDLNITSGAEMPHIEA